MQQARPDRKGGVAAAARSFVESLEGRQLLATHVVSNLNDSGAGSLRQAFTVAAANDTIDARGVTGTLLLNGSISLNNTKTGLKLLGPGVDELTIKSAHLDRLFVMNAAGLEISDVTLQGSGGYADQGGAFLFMGNDMNDPAQHLTLDRVTVFNTYAWNRGGAIDIRDAHLTIRDSTFRGNAVSNQQTGGGGMSMAVGGAIVASDTQTLITGSTFHSNSAIGAPLPGDSLAQGRGGALFTAGGMAEIRNSTFTNNEAYGQDETGTNGLIAHVSGGAIRFQGSSVMRHVTVSGNRSVLNFVVPPSGPTLEGAVGGVSVDAGSEDTTEIYDSIIAGNTSTAGTADLYVSGDPITVERSLIGKLGTYTLNRIATPGASNLLGDATTGIAPMLNALADNGGRTLTMAPLSGSPAIRTGGTSTHTDQRGYYARNAADMGAFEVGALSTPSAIPEFTLSPKAFLERGATAGYLRGLAEVSSGEVTYQWKRLAKPDNAADPILSAPTARTTNAQFFKAGEYAYRLTATGGDGESVSKRLIFTIDAVGRNVHIVQHGETFTTTAPTRFQARVYDQFGGRVSPAPTTKWSLLEGEGRLTSTGLYTPAEGVDSTRIRIKARAMGLDGTAVNYVRAA